MAVTILDSCTSTKELQTISHFRKHSIASIQIKKLEFQANFKAKKENQHTHVRKISSGDYKEKLKPETIEILNRKFEGILKTLNYQI